MSENRNNSNIKPNDNESGSIDEDLGDLVLNLMKNRRSIRAYQKKEVPEDALMRILEGARWCQSASNRQPWRFIIVRNREKIKDLSSLATYGKFIRDAPVVIAIVADKREAPKWYFHDTCMVSHQICLIAWSLGLGTCWIGSLDRDAGAKLLKLKEGEYLTTILPIGYPRSIPPPTRRKSLNDLVEIVD